MGIDYDSRGWKEYLSKRVKGVNPPEECQLVDVINILREVKEGKARFVMTPDGHITAMKYPNGTYDGEYLLNGPHRGPKHERPKK